MSEDNAHEPVDGVGEGEPSGGEQEPQGDQEVAGDDAQDDGHDDEPGEPGDGREAAKWRHKLREVEAERDRLAASLENAQRQMVEAATGFYKPSAVWLTGAKPGDMFTQDGTLSSEAVEATVTAVMDEYGISRRPRPDALHVPREGSIPGNGTRSAWTDAFKD